MRFGFEHTYAALPSRFHERVRPAPAGQPRLVAFNEPLAAQLGLDPALIEVHAAALLSGRQLPDDADPIAMAYAGHQFGHFVPQLGDGRAILLGELRGVDGQLRDLQLKGAGRTRFSRGGDGRAVLGPMLREYLISEAMFALGVPTTRSLAVVETGERVRRDEGALPGAVLARVAASHVRVGTFEYFAAREDLDGLRTLLSYVIARHYPEAADAGCPPLAVLSAVLERQAALVAEWQRVGFIHGVMNTDNMSISGETIDYGPCAFMDAYDPHAVFSSIDHRGRYAYSNQPAIAKWNLARLAETLLPLVHAEPPEALGLATEVLQRFDGLYDTQVSRSMRRRLGLSTSEEGDAALVGEWLAALQAGAVDFTLAFRRLADAVEPGDSYGRDRTGLHALFPLGSPIDAWLRDWDARVERDPRTAGVRAADMRAASPAFIARNHRVEAALKAATLHGDLTLFDQLLQVLARPYVEQPDLAQYMEPPAASERVQATFCGT